MATQNSTAMAFLTTEEIKHNLIYNTGSWGCNSVLKHLHGRYKALGSIPGTEKRKN
jgi:hypothetical protein